MARLFVLALLGLAAYLLAWPVPVDPRPWAPGESPGFGGPYAKNQRLAELERVPVGGATGPEDLAADPEGTLYTTSHEGFILRRPPGGRFERWVETGGRPLGIAWDAAGDRLAVADAFLGLLAVTRSGAVERLTDEADGVPIRYADDVVAGADGKLYFSDASTKFGAAEWGGTYEASLLDIIEHGGHGRLLVFDPASGRTSTVLDGLQFANGVALTPDEESVLVVETGSYRVLRHHLAGPRAGTTETVIENLPGYPDNLNRSSRGYWLGLVSERRAVIDGSAGSPFVRRILQRLPAFLRPEATRYAHVIAFDLDGEVTANLQAHGPKAYARTTGAFEHEGALWITSLHEPALARMPPGRWE